MFANNFAQAPAHAVPRNRGPERARSDKASAKTSGVIRSKDAKQDRSAAVDAAVLFYLREFRGLSQAATLGKCEAFDRADDVALTRKKTGTSQVGSIDLNRPRAVR